MLFALTREVSAAMNRCELSFLPRRHIDLALARDQHHDYLAALAALGCRTLTLPDDPELPDSVFVEDAAVVLDEIAIVTRPGAASRRGETAAVAAALEPYRELGFIAAPGTLDGGDVLVHGRTLYVGETPRSNREGVRQLAELTGRFGYAVSRVGVSGCLHLKSSACRIGADTLLVNPERVDAEAFSGMRLLSVDPGEPEAANALRVADTVVYPASHPRTLERLAGAGIAVRAVDMGEFAKAEGGVTCCSLIFESAVSVAPGEPAAGSTPL